MVIRDSKDGRDRLLNKKHSANSENVMYISIHRSQTQLPYSASETNIVCTCCLCSSGLVSPRYRQKICCFTPHQHRSNSQAQ